ncbi:MAG TPA: hypothetical protein VFL14_04975 [Xanthomonadales bacterium]|nr:hypothetical protein [Xanthomonadales bacterium]
MSKPIAARLAPSVLLAALAATSAVVAAEHAASLPPANTLTGIDRGLPPEIVARKQRIERGLAALAGHPWAGAYYRDLGIDHAEVLLVSPTDGMAAWYPTGGWKVWNQGSVTELADGTLQLQFDAPNVANGEAAFPEKLVPVRWGERSYLVPADGLAMFVSDINYGDEPRRSPMGYAFVREVDLRKPAPGLPVLPDEYARLIRTESVDFAIERVTAAKSERDDDPAAVDGCFRHWRIDIATGDDDRLHVGQLLAFGPGNDHHDLKLDAVGDGHASGTWIAYEDDCRRPELVPTTGWRVRTGAVGYQRQF